MGISSSCFITKPSSSPPTTKIIFYGGTTKTFTTETPAAELMFKNPDKIICHANSFYIGHPIPIISMEDSLISGETYFVLPIDFLPCNANLTTATLASLASKKQKETKNKITDNISGSSFPFEYIKGDDGRMLIRVLPEFFVKVISDCDGGDDYDVVHENDVICTTPELRKQYAQLVGSRDSRQWSPKLETIKERRARGRVSPVRLLGLGL